MKVTLENGHLSINVLALLESLTTEEKRGFVDSLACENDIIEDVAAQIIKGWTEMGSHGYKHGGDADPTTPLDKAIRAVALAADSVAAKEVDSLATAMRRQHAYHVQIDQWAWKMYHMMNEAHNNSQRCPDSPPCPSSYDATPDEWVVVKKDGGPDQ